MKEAERLLLQSLESFMESLTFVDLFAGVGGFSLSLLPIGLKCVWSCEKNKQARLTYKANFGKVPFYDVTKVELRKGIEEHVPSFDVLTAGFPCQDFSTLGQQKGLEGSKGTLFYEIIKFLAYFKPRFVLLENVKGLLTSNKGENMKLVLEELEKVGYRVQYKLLNSLALLPQFRNRVYIIGVLNQPQSPEQHKSELEFFDLPTFSPKRKLCEILQTEAEEPFLEYYQLSTPKWKNVKRSKIVKQKGIVHRLVSPEDTVCDTIISNYRTSLKNAAQFVSKYGREELAVVFRKASEEVTAEASPGQAERGTEERQENVERRPRWFTSRELARLMGFPERFRPHPNDSISCEQIGNAVTPPVVIVVAISLFASEYLNSMEGKAAVAKTTLTKLQVKALISKLAARRAVQAVLESMHPSQKQSFLQKAVSVKNEAGQSMTVQELIHPN